MSNELIPGRNIALEIALLGIILSAIAYGVVVALVICCVNALVHPTSNGDRSSAMTKFLLCYIGVLLGLSTWALVQGAYSIMSAIFHSVHDSDGSFNWLRTTECNPWFLPITVWTADAFLVWRCSILYEGISRARRMTLVVSLTLLCLMSLVAGLFTLVPLSTELGLIVFISVSGAINVILSALIILRLYCHKKSTQRIFDLYRGKLYTRIIVMLTESCALIVVFTAMYIALYVTPMPNGKEVPLFLLPQICVISPLLIVYRVSRRRAYPETYSDDHLSITSSMSPYISFSTTSSPIHDSDKNCIWNTPGDRTGPNDT